jgi:hypothetical protein
MNGPAEGHLDWNRIVESTREVSKVATVVKNRYKAGGIMEEYALHGSEREPLWMFNDLRSEIDIQVWPVKMSRR